MSGVVTPDVALARLRGDVDLEQYYVANFQWRQLKAAIDRCALAADALGEPYGGRLREGAGNYLARRMCWFYQKTFVYDLNCYTGGSESEESFQKFVRHLADESVQGEIARRYAPLIQRVDKFLGNFARFVSAHCEHWCSDREMLNSRGYASSLVPDSIQFGLGDPHHGARSSVALTFGTDKLYYKPRSLDLDLLFAEVQGCMAPWMRHLETIDRGAYGWQRGVLPAAPEGEVAAATFFRHVGSAVAVLHLLSGSDFHFENVVSDENGYPYFVDMEALFTQRDFSDSIDRDPVPRTSAERRFQGQIRDSIFSIGLVPYSQAREGGFSGLAEAAAVRAPVSGEVAVDEKRGNMRLARKTVAVAIDSAIPKIGSRSASPGKFINDLVDGFVDAMQLAASHRDELLSMVKGRAWNSRQIYRNTYVYYLFLAESTHPVIASDPSGFHRLMGKLSREHAIKPFLSRSFDAEVAEMHAFDIPCFSAASGGTSVTLGGQDFTGFFTTPVIEAVQQRLAGLDGSGIEEQAEFLRRAYGRCVPTRLAAGAGCQAIIDIVDWLASMATVGADGQSVTWRHSPPADILGEKVAVTTMGPDIYSGIGGLLWFLSEAALVVPDDRIERLYGLVRISATSFVGERLQFCQPGALTGYHGLLWVLCNDALRHGREEAWNEWRTRLCLDATYEAVSSCDVVDGLAGCVLQLVSLHKSTHDKELLESAGRLVERMLATARKDSTGLSWHYEAMQRPLLGFGHGGAGIACAIHAYARAAGDPSLLGVVSEIFRFEDAHFDEKLGLWPDLRAEHPSFTTSWCNGLAGHLLARVVCFDVLTDHQQAITRIAAETLLRHGQSGENDSLCHGTLGNVEALDLAARVLGDQRLAVAADSVLRQIGERGSFRSGWESDPSNIGMYVGAVGYAMTLLRTMSDTVSSALLFRPSTSHLPEGRRTCP